MGRVSREEKRRRKKIKKEKESERVRKSQKESERVRKSQKESERVRQSQKESERVRKSQKESERVRKSQKKEDADARKGRKVAKHRVFPMICGSGGSKSRPAPAGQMRDEKLHAVAARSTLQSQKCTKHTVLGPLLELARSKKCMPLWCEAHFEVTSIKKTDGPGALLQVETSKKRAAAVGQSALRSQNVKNTTCSDLFWTFRCRFAWQAGGGRDCAPCQK